MAGPKKKKKGPSALTSEPRPWPGRTKISGGSGRQWIDVANRDNTGASSGGSGRRESTPHPARGAVEPVAPATSFFDGIGSANSRSPISADEIILCHFPYIASERRDMDSAPALSSTTKEAWHIFGPRAALINAMIQIGMSYDLHDNLEESTHSMELSRQIGVPGLFDDTVNGYHTGSPELWDIRVSAGIDLTTRKRLAGAALAAQLAHKGHGGDHIPGILVAYDNRNERSGDELAEVMLDDRNVRSANSIALLSPGEPRLGWLGRQGKPRRQLQIPQQHAANSLALSPRRQHRHFLIGVRK
jgi:hypothetical protein